ncbi:MAG: hypothetical protein IPK19_12680 [Chloroflexi bacterium]|nr:hypothetical protein [Chloroflexota bacterium]
MSQQWTIQPMRILRHLFTASAVLVLALHTFLSAAQDDAPFAGSEPLAAALQFVPDDGAARSWLTFADYRAAEAARGLTTPDDFAAFMADDEMTSSWIAAMPSTGMQMNYFMQFDDMPDVLGIDFFDINQSLGLGLPPDEGLILRGSFDLAAIRAAHLARDFVEEDVNGIPRWCSPDGCDTGMNVDFANRQPADVFGGDLGRRFPRALANDVLVGSGSDVTLNAALNAGADGASYADNPLVVAALAALDGGHHLRAVQFARPDDFLALSLDGMSAVPSEEEVREYQDGLRGGIDNLPVYNLVAFADAADADSEMVLIALVYRNEEVAQIAAGVLDARLQRARSAFRDATWADLIAERGGTVEPTQVIAVTEADRAVTLLVLRGPLPGDDPDENGRLRSSGLLFQLILDGFYRRDLGWLQPVLLN